MANHVTSTAAFNLSRILLGSAFVVVLAAMLAWAVRIHRIESSRRALDQLNATHFWQHQTFGSQPHSISPLRRIAARWLGDSTVSGLSVVNIDAQAEDQQLGFIDSLYEVRTLKLCSDLATDRTLELISKLPNLKNLTLVGSKFTIRGLLQLRQAKSLQRLTLGADQLTPMQFAVLSDAVPCLELLSRSVSQTPEYDPPQSGQGRLIL
ncbi:MAG: hypothetical protein KDB22_03385 [Planctomycetales bacterium]|nr:hypothetical protein [Planctomycetales bacterium]